MASLGTLVRGISHEINTPLGVGLTTASYLSNSASKLLRGINEGQLTKSTFQDEIKSLVDGTKLLLSSLEKKCDIGEQF